VLDSGMPGCCLQQRQSACLGEAQMKFMLLTATFVLLMAVGGIAAPAQAADCLRAPPSAASPGIMPAITAFSAPVPAVLLAIMRRPKRAREKAQQQPQGPSSESRADPNSEHYARIMVSSNRSSN